MITKEQQLQRAVELLQKHRLHNWTVAFADLSNTPTRSLTGASSGAVGVCHFAGRQILIDTSLIGREYRCRQTILHEVAHALVGRRGHDAAWMKIARRVGVTKKELDVYKFAIKIGKRI